MTKSATPAKKSLAMSIKKTPTQLRNERKRRAKKQQKQHAKQQQDPSLQYIQNPDRAPVVQRAKQFFRSKGLDFTVFCGETKGWRTLAKLAVRFVNGELSIGLFVPGSHQLVPVPDCIAHHPSINKAVTQIQSVARDCRVQAYDEVQGKGEFRHVCLAVEQSTKAVQITLVWNNTPDDENHRESLDKFCQRLIKSMSDKSLQLHSLWVHYNATWKHANSIIDFTGSWKRVYGPEFLTERLRVDGSLSTPLYFSPQVFRQANLNAFTGIVKRIRGFLSLERIKKQRCLELYGGVGTIGLYVADLFSSFISSDENPNNLAAFQLSVASISSLTGRVRYEPRSATSMVELGSLQEADVVLVDPPRKGLDDAVSQGLCNAASVRLLVYVSCGFDAFQRDFQVLQCSYNLVAAEGHILFPGSDAIETLAFFRRKTS